MRAAWALKARLDECNLAFDYVLVDEAGQALELEAYAALALGKPGARVLLAGDTKQLGPVCRSAQRGSAAGGAGSLLRCSLLERLSERHPRWQSPESPWAVRLCRNYRSHPAILELLSKTRYDGRLLACASPEVVRRFEQLDLLPTKGFPIMFVGVRGQQQMDLRNENQHCLSRPDIAHSFHNPEEALAVLEIVRDLLRPSSAEVATVDDIGIVCAFRRQVQKVRGLLRAEGFDAIRVGTVEDYQGQQERILIVTTTLSDPSHVAPLQQLEPTAPLAGGVLAKEKTRGDVSSALEICIRNRLQREEAEQRGTWPVERQTANLVGNARRYTVALSRAQCLLLVVGSPEVLESSPHWRHFLLYVAARGSLRGEPPSAALVAAASAAFPREGVAEGEDPSAGSVELQVAEGPAATLATLATDEPTMPEPEAAVDESETAPLALDLRRTQEELTCLKAAERERLQLVEAYAAEVSMLASDLRRCNAQRELIAAHAAELERDRQENADDLRCVVCLDARKAVAFLPCGHVAVCKACCPALFSRADPRCPSCRGPIDGNIFVFF